MVQRLCNLSWSNLSSVVCGVWHNREMVFGPLYKRIARCLRYRRHSKRESGTSCSSRKGNHPRQIKQPGVHRHQGPQFLELLHRTAFCGTIDTGSYSREVKGFVLCPGVTSAILGFFVTKDKVGSVLESICIEASMVQGMRPFPKAESWEGSDVVG